MSYLKFHSFADMENNMYRYKPLMTDDDEYDGYGSMDAVYKNPRNHRCHTVNRLRSANTAGYRAERGWNDDALSQLYSPLGREPLAKFLFAPYFPHVLFSSTNHRLCFDSILICRSVYLRQPSNRLCFDSIFICRSVYLRQPSFAH